MGEEAELIDRSRGGRRGAGPLLMASALGSAFALSACASSPPYAPAPGASAEAGAGPRPVVQEARLAPAESAHPDKASETDAFFAAAWPAPEFVVAQLPASTTPTVRASEVMVGDPQGLARAALGRHHRGVRECYLAGVRRDPTLEGRVVVGLVVRKARVVEEVRILEDKTTLGDEGVTACVRDQLLGAAMPFFGEGPILVAHRYEMVLRPPGSR